MKKSSSKESNSKASVGAPDKIPIFEWVLAGTGFLLISFAIIFFLLEAFQSDKVSPEIKITIISIKNLNDMYLANIKVENISDVSVEGVIIEGELKNDDKSIEKSQIEFNYLPARSERTGGLFFKENPRNFYLQIKPLGFEEP